MRRREFLLGGAGLAAGAFAAGCGVGPQSAPKQVAVKVVPPKIDGDLLIFNWTEYMNPKVIKRFEKLHDVKVTVSNFDSMPAMMAKLRSGNRYDLIFPTADYVARLNRLNQLRPLDRAALKNGDGVYGFFDDEGLVNSVVTDVGISSDPVQFLNTPWAVIGGLVYGYLGFMILPIYASLERMDPALIEAGKDLYGSPRQTFWHVTWPQTVPGVLAGTVLVFLPAVGDFVSAQLLGGPDTYMVGNLIQQQFFGADNWPFGAALTIVLMAFLAIFIFFYLRVSSGRREGLA